MLKFEVIILNNITGLVLKFIVTLIISLLTLSLFDTNSILMTLIYVIIATLINWYLQQTVLSFANRELSAIIQGLIAGGLAWIMAWALASFRVTFATWLAFVILLSFSQYYLNKLMRDNIGH